MRPQSKWLMFLLALALGTTWLAGEPARHKTHAQEQKMQQRPKPQGLKNTVNLLWIFEEKETKGGFAATVREKLAKCKVENPRKAEKTAGMYKLHHGGLDANESSKVIGLIRLGRRGTEMGEKGDFIWIVRYAIAIHGVTQEFWVNATTGKVYPVLKDS
jgi:hypothetical protein